jgi:hypothetical protein
MPAGESLLAVTSGLRPAVRQRVSPFFLRMALEQAVDDFWADALPGLVRCSRRAQLLCLREWVGRDTAQRVEALWVTLSSACHYNTYELAPTTGELRTWEREVIELYSALDQADRPPSTINVAPVT